MSTERDEDRRAIVYWEDMIGAPMRHYGPLVFSSQLLDQLLELMGERHPIHDSDAFAQMTSRKQRIVPGGFIHSITSGWVVQHSAPVAVVGLRSVTWDFVRPLYPDKPFFFTNHAKRTTQIDERLGLVDTERRVVNEMGQLHAIGRMNVVLMRRSAPAAMIETERPSAPS